ncbi:hypothetical protein NDU88_006576 [Pleurodeles waltl]|uniref:Uncharacterized protein n=1 Tax=Pleurodeles waltl TaxID=8319 RepID=A0AAV7MG48_PLEWA|nr:hypothetical protein NDU88_006576 [Pleurodeles waltl]
MHRLLHFSSGLRPGGCSVERSAPAIDASLEDWLPGYSISHVLLGNQYILERFHLVRALRSLQSWRDAGAAEYLFALFKANFISLGEGLEAAPGNKPKPSVTGTVKKIHAAQRPRIGIN